MNKEVVVRDKELQNIDIKNWVTKSNELIESTYKLSLQEQRILLILASKVQPNDETLKTYSFRAKDFIEIVGNKKGTGFYSYLKGIVNGLQTKVLTIKKNGKQSNFNWVITSIYEDNEGFITLQFHPNLKDFFLELKEKFTTYQLENVVRLNSVYSIRIYELLKQYERLKRRKLTIDELRRFLGIEENKYRHYGHLKNKVLMAAQNEINSKTDIKFEFNEIKTVRKVTSIEFKIESNTKELSEKQEKDTEEVSESQDNDILEIRKIGAEIGLKLHDNVIKEWLQYGKESVIKLIENIKYKENVKNPIGYISSVLPRIVSDEVEDGEALIDQTQEAVRNFIIKYKRNLEPIPVWLLEELAIKEFKKFVTDEEAEVLWLENKEKITNELKGQKEMTLV